MFGVTTPCADTIRHHPATSSSSSLSSQSKIEYGIFTFHATGHGGLAMERLISSSTNPPGLDAVIDLTTSEIADEIVRGESRDPPGG